MSENKKGVSCSIGCGSGVVGLVSLAAGAYHGYCNARGIPITSESLDWWVTWGPAAVQAGIGALYGVIGGGLIGLTADNYRPARGGAYGSLIGAGTGAAIGAAKGGLETLVGYGVGYGIGFVAGKQ